MQRRIANSSPKLTLIRLSIALLIAISLLILLPEIADSQATSVENSPIVLLVIDTPARVKSKDELNVAIKDLLRDALNDSKRYTVHVFFPNESLIKRALKDGVITPDDLVEPYKPESLKRIALTIGAQSVLSFYSVQGKSEVTTKYRLYENNGPDIWTTKFDSEARIDAFAGKRRLKIDEIARIFTDQMAASAGVTTHLSEKMASLNSSRVIYDPDKKKKKDAAKEPSHKKTAIKPDGEMDTNGTEENVATGALSKSATEEASPNLKKTVAKPAKIKISKNQKPQITPQDQTKPLNQTPYKPADAVNEPIEQTSTSVSTQTIDTNKPNYVEQARQYKGNGDFASAIGSLRKAVNEKPLDVDLRRQLALAYFDHKMGDVALVEANRIIQLDPENGSLHRLYGELLLKQGDTTGALEALKKAQALAPNDIMIQVSLGDALLKIGKYSEAVNAYEGAVKSDSKSPLPHRRLARAFVGNAEQDPTQYEISLAQLKIARDLTPTKESQAYQEDYIALLRLLEKRISGMLNELADGVSAKTTGKSETQELIRRSKDLKQRAEKLSEYLDAIPRAAGLEGVHAHYSQSNSFLVQAINFYREALIEGDERVNSKRMNAQIFAQRELDIASTRLNSAEK